MNDVEFMADLESVILRGSWPSTVGMVALNGCRRCTTILDCRRAVEVVVSAAIHPSGAALSADMFCDKCFDEHVYPDIESGRLRQRVAKNLNRPLWAPPPAGGLCSGDRPGHRWAEDYGAGGGGQRAGAARSGICDLGGREASSPVYGGAGVLGVRHSQL